MDQRGPSLSPDLCMHAGGWRIHTRACTFFHPRLNAALLAPGELLAEAQMKMAEGREHLPGTRFSVHLGLWIVPDFSLITKASLGYTVAFDNRAPRGGKEQPLQ